MTKSNPKFLMSAVAAAFTFASAGAVHAMDDAAAPGQDRGIGVSLNAAINGNRIVAGQDGRLRVTVEGRSARAANTSVLPAYELIQS